MGLELAKSDSVKRVGCVLMGGILGAPRENSLVLVTGAYYSIAQQQLKAPGRALQHSPFKVRALPLHPADSIQQGARGDQGWHPDAPRPNSGSKSLEPSVAVLPPPRPPDGQSAKQSRG